jgi:RNA polymerase sigma factor (sigma-70 family)
VNWSEIIAKCIDGERKSQKILYEYFADGMFVVCLRYVKTYDEAQDILQEGFVRVFNKMYQYSFQGSFEGWVRKVFVHCAIEHLRSKKMKFTDIESIPVIEDPAALTVLSQLSADDILKLIQELSPQYRLVFNLYALEGYNHKEIAELLGISEGTSKSNLSRARVILQKKLQGHNVPEEKEI